MCGDYRGYSPQDLLIALDAENPKDKEFTSLLYDQGIGIGGYNARAELPIVSSKALQSLVNAAPQQDIAVVLEGISASKRCICRIEVPNFHVQLQEVCSDSTQIVVEQWHSSSERI